MLNRIFDFLFLTRTGFAVNVALVGLAYAGAVYLICEF